MKRLAFAITLVLVLVGSALAQSADPVFGPGFSLSVSKMPGVEATSGTLDATDGICWGRTFAMMSDSGSFTLAPDYYYEQRGEPTEYVSKIVGGSWTMTYKGRRQYGMLFGELTGGTIEWRTDKAGNVYGVITASLNIKGGTGSFATVGGAHTFGVFNGTVDYSQKPVPHVEGSVDLFF